MIRIRKDTNANYKAVFLPSGKTLRFKLDSRQSFKAPRTAEIEDVAINNRCLANCSYCYTDAKASGINFTYICDKAQEVWGQMPMADRPFQIAIGGAGESTLHPDWCEFVRFIKSLGIMPNYTTNGMHLSDEILSATQDYCGGVALSWHPHIPLVFHKAVAKLRSIKTRLNFHIIVGDQQSLIDLIELYDRYHDIVEYFVILPYQAVGRGRQIEVAQNWEKCFRWVESLNSTQFAFGALFYEFLWNNHINLPIDIYEPEIFSGYRIFDESYKTLRKSSYDLSEKIPSGANS